VALNLTRKLTLTHAVLTVCVLLPAGVAIYLATKGSLLRESLKNADLAVQTTAREFLSQLDEDILLEFKGSALPFNDLRISAKHWALARGSGRFLNGAGVFQGNDSEQVRETLGSETLRLPDGGNLLVKSIPVPKLQSEPFASLPSAVQATVQEKCPGGSYIRCKRGVVGTKLAYEIQVLWKDKLAELQIKEDGQFAGGELVEIPKTCPIRYVEELLGPVGSSAPADVEWKAFDSQLIAVFSWKAEQMQSGESKVIAANRYGERFTIGPDGDLSGPTNESAIRLIVGAEVMRVPALLLTVLLAGGPLVWILVVAIGWYVTRRAFSPVERIVNAAERIRPPHLNARLPVGQVKDELSSIAETMNRMLDRLEQGFLREKQFTGDASHELRGPLAKVIAEIDLILSTDRSLAEYRDALVRCRGYAESLKRIVESLFLLARLDQETARLDMQATDIETLLVHVINRLPQVDAERVDLELEEGSGPIVVQCDGRLISVLVRNVIENALRYSPQEERVKVRIRRESGTAVLEVEDHGPGIPEDRKEQVFDRFFRLDESRSRDTGGAGLGLAIVRAIARAHASKVELRRSPQGGTTIACCLPLSQRKQDGQQTFAAPGGNGGSVAAGGSPECASGREPISGALTP